MLRYVALNTPARADIGWRRHFQAEAADPGHAFRGGWYRLS